MNNHEPGWLDKPRNVTRIVYTLYAICALLLIADLLYTKHVHFAFEGWFGFFPLVGFAAYLFIVMSAKLLRRLIARPEDYYERKQRGGSNDA